MFIRLPDHVKTTAPIDSQLSQKEHMNTTLLRGVNLTYHGLPHGYNVGPQQLVNYQRGIEFIHEHGDRRITQEAYNYYKEPHAIGIFIVAVGEGEVLCVSGARVITKPDLSYTTDLTITVTHKNWRNQGLGTMLLTKKIEWLHNCVGNKVYHAIVAKDNGASVRMCEKADLMAAEILSRQRRSGLYEAILFKEKP